MGSLQVCYLAFSAIPPIGVVYTGNNVFPPWTRMGQLTVQSWSNFNRDGACPVPHLQVVNFPV